jgi:hypothetical protein
MPHQQQQGYSTVEMDPEKQVSMPSWPQKTNAEGRHQILPTWQYLKAIFNAVHVTEANSQVRHREMMTAISELSKSFPPAHPSRSMAEDPSELMVDTEEGLGINLPMMTREQVIEFNKKAMENPAIEHLVVS